MESPYSVPVAAVADSVGPDIPPETLSKIRNAWRLGLLSFVAYLALIVAASFTAKVATFTVAELVELVLIGALSFGIFKKSRTCAVLILVHLVLARIATVAETKSFGGLWLGAVFAYIYFQGIVGTYDYHAIFDRARRRALAYAEEGVPLPVESGPGNAP